MHSCSINTSILHKHRPSASHPIRINLYSSFHPKGLFKRILAFYIEIYIWTFLATSDRLSVRDKMQQLLKGAGFCPKASWGGSAEGNPHIQDWGESCSAPAVSAEKGGAEHWTAKRPSSAARPSAGLLLLILRLTNALTPLLSPSQ